MRKIVATSFIISLSILIVSIVSIANGYAAYKDSQLYSENENIIYIPIAPSGIDNPIVADDLAEAIDLSEPGDEICLTSDISINTIEISKDITIKSYDGLFSISKAGDGKGMFIVDGSSLTMENVCLNAENEKQGRTLIAKNDSTITIGNGSKVIGNTLYGAIYLDHSTLTVSGEISGNSATIGEPDPKKYPAGGTWGESTRYAYDSATIEAAPYGGAVLMVNGSSFKMTDTGCIKSNTAKIGGGAIYADHLGSMTTNGGVFQDNSIIDTSQFVAGDWRGQGGAIAVGNTAGIQMEFVETVFDGNAALRSGVFDFQLDVSDVDFVLDNCLLQNNKATNNGAIMFSGASNTSYSLINGTQISDNAATADACFYFVTHPNYIDGDKPSTMRIEDVTVEDNVAGSSTFLLVNGSHDMRELHIENSIFNNNTATGNSGVLNFGATELFDENIDIVSSKFTNNVSGHNGGALFFDYAKRLNLTIKDTTFDGNSAGEKAAWDGDFGGAIYLHSNAHTKVNLDGAIFNDNSAGTRGGAIWGRITEGAVFTVNGSKLTNNHAAAGAALCLSLDDANTEAIFDGETIISGNVASQNASVLFESIAEDMGGTVRFKSCSVTDNVCQGIPFHEEDSIQHYNTGGVYVGERVVLLLTDTVVTDNYVEKGFSGETIGSGIGLCPNANAAFYPSNGAYVYGNGDTGMDILAVPYDDMITQVGLPRLYICDMTPTNEAYNWTGLDGKTIRTGEYNWDVQLKEKESEKSGLSISSIENDIFESGEYQSEENLDPIGFKSNAANAELMMMETKSDFSPKVIIANNHTKSAVYGAGGVMVNGTLISGDFTVSVEKKVKEGTLSPEDLENKEFGFTMTITKNQQYDNENDAKNGWLTSYNATYTTNAAPLSEQSAQFTQSITTTETVPNKYQANLSYNFSLKANDKITFKFNAPTLLVPSTIDYLFSLSETDGQGGTGEFTYTVNGDTDHIYTGDTTISENNNPNNIRSVESIEFTCLNTFENGSIELSKNVENGGDTDRLWEFILTVQEANGSYSAELWEDGNKSTLDGSQGDLSYADGVTTIQFSEKAAHVWIKDNQTLKITGLPIFNDQGDSTYEVTEVLSNTIPYITTQNNESGKLTSGVPVEVTFTNTKMTPVSYAPTIAKNITGDSEEVPENTIFTFLLNTPQELADGQQEISDESQTITGKGTAKFNDITFDRPGSYTYYITEKKESALGYTYDDSIWTLTVVVARKADSNDLEITQTNYSKNGVETADTATFTNIYTKQLVAFTPEISKTITGDTPEKNETFTFILRSSEDLGGGSPSVNDTKTIEGQGTAQFTQLSFEKPGTYTYTISEQDDEIAGYTYDTSIWTLTVTVSQNAANKLEISESKYSKESIDNAEIASFVNSYETPKISFSPKVAKTITGDTPPSDRTFSFELKTPVQLVPGQDSVSETTNITGEGTASFNELTFTQPGSYSYLITEQAGSTPGYTYDDSEWTLTIVVEEKNNGLEIASTKYSKEGTESEEDAIFINSYEVPTPPVVTPVSYIPRIMKEITGDTPLVPENFIFTLKSVDNGTDNQSKNIEDSKTISGAGTVQFATLNFEEPGIYTYQITETAGTNEHYIYDDSIWTLTIEISENENNELVLASAEYSKNGVATYDIAIFTNIYEEPIAEDPIEPTLSQIAVTPKVKKTIVNESEEKTTEQTFTFTLSADEDNVVSGYTLPSDDKLTIEIAGEGIASFGDIVFTEPGEYIFTIQENKGNDTFYVYDDNTWILTVNVDEEDNELVATSTYDNGEQNNNEYAEFSNIFIGNGNIVDNDENKEEPDNNVVDNEEDNDNVDKNIVNNEEINTDENIIPTIADSPSNDSSLQDTIVSLANTRDVFFVYVLLGSLGILTTLLIVCYRKYRHSKK